MKKNSVFYISLIITATMIVLGLVVPTQFAYGMNVVFQFLSNNFNWLYLLAMFVAVIFSLFIAFSKFGKIKLGDDDSVPEYSTLSWLSMLFASGAGIGLIFWGVAEPLNHYTNFGSDSQAAELAMRKSFMHWGFHPWAGYAIIGMALAYFQFRKKAPGLISSIFLPLLGEKGVKGPIGKLIDICAVFATIAGVATSLGQGTLQINAGLNFLFGIPQTNIAIIIIIVCLTILYTFIAIKGMKGAEMLSNIALFLAIALMIGSFIIGPKLVDIKILINTMGSYLQNFVQDSLSIDPFENNEWLNSWTIFYWAWWIAWGPFVGTFIARISKGRTIREFIGGVILVPSVFSMLWFSVFGGLGLNTGDSVISEAIKKTETALFVVLNEYPISMILSVMAVVMLCMFFSTSANSATFVLSMFTSNGDLNPKASKKALWGILQALLALVLLLSGGLSALQSCSIVAAFPFSIIMLLTCVCLYKSLSQEKISIR